MFQNIYKHLVNKTDKLYINKGGGHTMPKIRMPIGEIAGSEKLDILFDVADERNENVLVGRMELFFAYYYLLFHDVKQNIKASGSIVVELKEKIVIISPAKNNTIAELSRHLDSGGAKLARAKKDWCMIQLYHFRFEIYFNQIYKKRKKK